MPVRTLTDVVGLIRPRLAANLPGVDSQLKMAPSQRAALLQRASRENARPAAVLVILENEVAPAVVLTERRHDLESHPGQISFPGGRQESDESLLDAALREAREEVNLRDSEVEVLGEMSPLFVPPSNYLVHPFLAFSVKQLDLSPSDSEVSAIIRAPLQDLLNPELRRTEQWERYGRIVEVPLFDVGGYKVWGATAMMLSELVDLVESV